MSEIKLLPCPFCGGEAEVYEQKHREYASTYYARCKSCHCKSIERIGKGIVIEQWNTRKPMERIVERLEEERKGYICDGDDYCEGAYNTYGEAIAVVKEEGGIE